MFRITPHIERLLPVHDCVILPGIGGFVLQTVPARYGKEEHIFYPMRKEIVFNSALQHNDGLLPESYMQAYQTDYRNAQKMVEEDIAELKAALFRTGKVSLGAAGSLSLGEENRIVFAAGKMAFADADSYGLAPFSFPVLPQQTPLEERKEEILRKDILYIPLSMRFVRGLVAGVAVFALFFPVSAPESMQQPVHTAGVVAPHFLVPQWGVVPDTTDENISLEEAADSLDVMVEAPAVMTDSLDVALKSPDVAVKSPDITVEAPPVTIPEAVTEVSPSPTASPTAQPKKKTYHIIIGSFPSEQKAHQFIAEMAGREHTDSLGIVSGDRFRVYVSKHNTRQDATLTLSSIRQTYTDAWLLSQ